MVNEAQYDMKGYLNMAEVIARKKLEMYSKLLSDINDFRMKFGHEIWVSIIAISMYWLSQLFNADLIY